MVGIPIGIVIGFVGWFMLRYIVTSFYTVNQNERAVKTSFGRAQRVGKATTLASWPRRCDPMNANVTPGRSCT